MSSSRLGVVIAERACLRKPLAMDGDDVRGERLPGESVGVNAADDVTAGVTLAEISGLAGALDVGLVLVAIPANKAATYGRPSTRA
jgi:hypothetical protein